MGRNASNSRLIAAQILADWLENQDFPERKLLEIKHDRAFIMELVHGSLRQQLVLTWLETKMINRTPSILTRSIIHVGFYQLLFLNNVEIYAAINECVEAAKCQSNGLGAAKLVNAVLRRCDRERDEILCGLKNEPLSIQLSHPPELLKGWMDVYGEKKAINLAEWNNRPAETIIRVEKSRVDLDVYLDELQGNDIDPIIHTSSGNETFIIVPRGISVTSLPGYKEGWFVVQDPATAKSVDLLAPKKEEEILDACAAPGGKTSLIASRMQNDAGLVAMELHTDRLPKLKSNLNRMRFNSVEIVQGDARNPHKALGSRDFDGILLDVPCSNSGVLRRRSDARWRINADRMKKLNELQYEMLTACSKILKFTGRLVYSTCSLEQSENEFLIERWLSDNTDFYLENQVKTVPPESNMDGAFAGLIRRR